jgi:hypothetical protein
MDEIFYQIFPNLQQDSTLLEECQVKKIEAKKRYFWFEKAGLFFCPFLLLHPFEFQLVFFSLY